MAERPESQDLCFLAGQDYRAFLRRNGADGFAPGPVLDTAGNAIGRHEGLPGYTIGQRRGIGVSANQALYVIAKDVAANALIVGPRESLGRTTFRTLTANWVSADPPEDGRQAEVQVRYRASRVPCEITLLPDGTVDVRLEHPLPDVTPGQSAVFYRGEVCLGGAVIAA